MTFANVLQDTSTRMRNPWIWLILMGFYIPASLTRITPALSLGSGDPAVLAYILLSPFLGLSLFAWVAPWAWLWTGCPDEYPGALRGVGQGLALGLGLGALVLGVDEGLRALANPSARFQIDTLARGIPQVAVGSAFVGFLIVSLERATAARVRAEALAREAQWILLKGQLSPHVFFNAMSNLTELIRKDPLRAEQAALDLSDLFRRIMAHGQARVAPLGEERALVERYLAIEGLRLGDRIQIQWEWDPRLDASEAPPLLLQPLVENALKHGLGPKPEGGCLKITGHLEGARIHLRVANDGLPLSNPRPGGSGLDNLQGRLSLAFGRDASFSLGCEEGWVVSELSLPLTVELI